MTKFGDIFPVLLKPDFSNRKTLRTQMYLPSGYENVKQEEISGGIKSE